MSSWHFAESHHILARGHNLCWHQHNPAWLDAAVTPQNAVSLLTTHILTVAGRYKGRIHSWDVVNEAIHPDPPQSPRPDQFRLAAKISAKTTSNSPSAPPHEADPSALLTYNDFDIETDAPEPASKSAKPSSPCCTA